MRQTSPRGHLLPDARDHNLTRKTLPVLQERKQSCTLHHDKWHHCKDSGERDSPTTPHVLARQSHRTKQCRISHSLHGHGHKLLVFCSQEEAGDQWALVEGSGPMGIQIPWHNFCSLGVIFWLRFANMGSH